MHLGSFHYYKAQWKSISPIVRDTDVKKFTKQEHKTYKGISSLIFNLQVMVEKRKEGDKYNILLRTGSLTPKEYGPYYFNTGVKLKNCLSGKLIERNPQTIFTANEIGTEPFLQIMNTAVATFKVEVVFLVKDKKYKGGGYKSVHVFNNVKEDGVYWSDHKVEGDFDVDKVTILNLPKAMSFQADDSKILPAIEEYVKKVNEREEGICAESDNNKEVKSNTSPKTVSRKNSKDDGFWSGKKEKNIASKNKNTDSDFWTGGKEKTISNEKMSDSDFWNGGGGKKSEGNSKDDGDISNSVELLSDRKNGVIQLKNSNGIIKEWSYDDYYYVDKIDNKNNFFKLSDKTEGKYNQFANLLSIADKTGKLLTIDGVNKFGYIKPLDEGGYELGLFVTGSLYHGEMFLGGDGKFKSSYNSSSEAISEVEQFIERRKRERERESNKNSGDIVIGFVSHYNVVQVKQIIVNNKMQHLMSETIYKIQ